jgi:hypothetical protein
MDISQKISILAFILLTITALVIKIFDKDEQQREFYRYIFMFAVAILVFVPRTSDTSHNGFTTLALYALGSWFVTELLTLMGRIIPILTDLKDGLAKSKDFKRSLDKNSLIISDHLEDCLSQIEDVSNRVTSQKTEMIKQLQQDNNTLKKERKDLYATIINTYSNLMACEVDNQILDDFSIQLQNNDLILINKINVPFDSIKHISTTQVISTTDPKLNKKVAYILKVGLMSKHNEIIESAVVSRYRLVTET